MVQRIIADIADDVHQWLTAIAASKGNTIEVIIADKLADAYARWVQLTWKEQGVLNIFKLLNAKPGQRFPLRTFLLASINSPQTDLMGALNSLEAKGLVINHPGANPPHNVELELTAAGYQHP